MLRTKREGNKEGNVQSVREGERKQEDTNREWGKERDGSSTDGDMHPRQSAADGIVLYVSVRS